MRPSRFPAPKTVSVPKPSAISIQTVNVQAKNQAKAGTTGPPAPTFYPDIGSVEKAGGRS